MSDQIQTTPDSPIIEDAPFDNDVAIKMPKGRRLVYIIAVFCAIISHMFLFYAVNTIGISIASEFDALAIFALMFAIGTLTQSVLQPITPRLGDYFTKGRLVILGSVLLLAQAVICLTAPNIVVFLVGRGVGGLGAAFLFTLGIASFSDILPTEERAKYLGVFGTVMAIAGAAGPLVAGAIVDLTNGNWRLVMVLPLVLSIASTILAFICAPRGKAGDTEQAPFDATGALTLGLALICLVGLLSFAGVLFEWGSFLSIILSIGFLAFLALFILAERKKGLAAVVPLSLFRSRMFTLIALLMFLLMTTACYSFYGPAFVQSVMELNATSAGLMVTIPCLLSIFLATALGVLLSKTGRFKLLIVICTLGAALVFLFLSFMGPETGVFLLLANGTIFFGIANTIVSFVPIAAIQAKMEPRLIAVATGLVMFAQTLGSMILIAVCGAVFNMFPGAADGYIWVFRLCAALGVVSLILALLLPKDEKTISTH